MYLLAAVALLLGAMLVRSSRYQRGISVELVFGIVMIALGLAVAFAEYTN